MYCNVCNVCNVSMYLCIYVCMYVMYVCICVYVYVYYMCNKYMYVIYNIVIYIYIYTVYISFNLRLAPGQSVQTGLRQSLNQIKKLVRYQSNTTKAISITTNPAQILVYLTFGESFWG
jgi:hypothetical protein